jgi:hypothetical protein
LGLPEKIDALCGKKVEAVSNHSLNMKNKSKKGIQKESRAPPLLHSSSFMVFTPAPIKILATYG